MVVQSLMVAKAKEELEQEVVVKEDEKHKYLAERAPPLNTSGLSLGQLQVTPFPHSALHAMKTSGSLKHLFFNNVDPIETTATFQSLFTVLY